MKSLFLRVFLFVTREHLTCSHLCSFTSVYFKWLRKLTGYFFISACGQDYSILMVLCVHVIHCTLKNEISAKLEWSGLLSGFSVLVLICGENVLKHKMEHPSWQIHPESAPLIFIIVSTAGKWPPLCPLQPLQHDWLFIVPLVYFLLLLPTFPPVSTCFLPHFYLPACNWKDAFGYRITCSCPRGDRFNIHAWTFDSSTETKWRGWNAKKSALIAFLPPHSPSTLQF